MLPRLLMLAGVAALLPLSADEGIPTVPRLVHPGAGQTFYFVLADRFYNGDPDNDTGGIPGDRMDHGFDPTVVSHYHGGDFVGLMQQLDYLSGLGITAIWVTPPFKNKAVQDGTAGYHGYWITDFYRIDPHLGTNEEYRAFIEACHARGIRVYMDIIVNHTADVIRYRDGDYVYDGVIAFPDRDVNGEYFEPWEVAWNGLGPTDSFPELSAATSFAKVPYTTPEEAEIKNPRWLNDLSLYHNRGDTTFSGENSLYGDFVGLDDLYTEHPKVVQGFIDIYRDWISDFGVDGFRIDTAKHVNVEFWQAFSPAIRDHARGVGRPDFLFFGEIAIDTTNARFLSEYSTHAGLDSALDFGVAVGIRNFVSKRRSVKELETLFFNDDFYNDFDSSVHSNITFIGNHDQGRFAWFLADDNKNATDETLLALTRLGHGLLYLVRGQPTLYYGAEQGMIGYGNDMYARETMFASQAPRFKHLRLLGTDRTGADDKFDTEHPLYRLFSDLAALRREHEALRTGPMRVRPTGHDRVFAFSRFEPETLTEYLVVANASREERLTVRVSTAQAEGGRLVPVYDSQVMQGHGTRAVAADAEGRIEATLDPMEFRVWRAEAPLEATDRMPEVMLLGVEPGQVLDIEAYRKDGNIFSTRPEIRLDVKGHDGMGEVTFLLERSDRPDQFTFLGTDDAYPFRHFFRPPVDLEVGQPFSIIAIFDDRRGTRAAARVDAVSLGETDAPLGIVGAETPSVQVIADRSMRPVLRARATGTGPLHYQWFQDGELMEGETDPSLAYSGRGQYVVKVTNRAGAVVSRILPVP